jgi:AcrR family transcriptional regulator
MATTDAAASNIDETGTERRSTLTRERVLSAAVELADRDGIEAVSMRRLGQLLGIEAMSLYTHIRGKEDLLDGMVEVVVAGIPPAAPGPDWKATLRAMVLGARVALLAHPWAPRVIETRLAPGPSMLAYMDQAAGILRGGGFSDDLTHHAMHVLGSRVLGFDQDLFDDDTDPDADTADIAAALATTFPNIAAVALAASHEGGFGGCDDDYEFAFGLDLILDGLERRRDSAP